jgi:hypothetical protein
VKGPERFLDDLEISLNGVVEVDKPAILEPRFRTAVNGHLFWVSSEANLETMRADPYKYTGKLLDPVSHEWFLPGAESPRLDIGEGILLFSTAETLETHLARNEPYLGHTH